MRYLGQRRNDLRRRSCKYGRSAATTVSSGTHDVGPANCADVHLPVPTDEANNPNLRGCTNRRP